MMDVGRHPNISILTSSEVRRVERVAGDFRVKVGKYLGFVNEKECTGCGDCAKVCPVDFESEFELGMKKQKAIYRPFDQAVPNKFIIRKEGISPCRAACPVGVNVPGYVRLIASGKFDKALRLQKEKNPFPLICGRVCDHACEKECIRGGHDGPVAIASLKRFIADYELKAKGRAGPPAAAVERKKSKVAIVGSGPAGLAAAHALAALGYPVTVFEALPVAGGMLAAGIPAYRLPKDILAVEIESVKALGVEIKTSCPVGRDGRSIEDLKREGYEAFFIAVGAWKGMSLRIPGEKENRGVIDCIEFLSRVNLGDLTKPGDRVAVIGGGNSAVDAARTALRLGCREVSIVYRRSRQEMPADACEVEEAESEGARLHFLAAPVKILGKEGRVCGMECVRMRLGEPDRTGRRRPIPVEGSEFIINVDVVIPAVSQEPDLSFLPEKHGFRISKTNTLIVDSRTLQTSVPGVFAGGDAVTGPATVIEAIAAGQRAARSIDRCLRGEPLLGEQPARTAETARPPESRTRGLPLSPRRKMPALPVEERRGNFKEVLLGYSGEEAVEEAKRCLSCSVCAECMECVEACEKKAVDHNLPREKVLDLEVGAIILATGFEPFDPTPLGQYGYGRFKNVITSMQFERLISASGPTGGHLTRPSDGKPARVLGFIQCVGSRDVRFQPYCSSVCCMHSVKQAMLAKEHVRDTESFIFYSDFRGVARRFQEYILRGAGEYGIRYIRSRVSKVTETPEGDPVLWYEDTSVQAVNRQTVDLVILATALKPGRGAGDLASMLGIELDGNGFIATDPMNPTETTAPGIFACGCCESPLDIPESVEQASAAAARAAEAVTAPAGAGKVRV
jgi:heterodisulfide reductase subunit A-like polyferredoxin